jgi:serine/threonine protein kinase
VHGDIKPQNILVFGDGSESPTAKVTDFGYSCIGHTEDDDLNLPCSWLWCAPEREGNHLFRIANAKKTDVYSFGLVCFYTLFREHLGGDDASARLRGSEKMLHEWKYESPGLLPKARELLSRMAGLSENLKSSINQFFQHSLQDKPSSRSADFKSLINCLGYFPQDVSFCKER